MNIQSRIKEYLRNRTDRKHWLWIVICLAVAVSLMTSAVMTRPATAVTGDLVCGKEEHAHSEECYETLTRTIDCDLEEKAHQHDEECYTEEQVLTCDLEESEAHTHSEDCYAKIKRLVCDKEEYICIHTHDENCYDESVNLICSLEEAEEHEHDDSCYNENNELICGQREVVEHPEHTEECYTTDENGEKFLSCTKVLAVKHQHDDECVHDGEMVLTCGMEEHTHNDSCYEKINGKTPADLPDGETEAKPLVFENTDTDVHVTVTADEDAFPAGTVMVVTPVDSEEVIDAVSDTFEDKNVVKVKAVDITFYYYGEEIEPTKPITVSMSAAPVKEAQESAVLHINNDGAADIVAESDNIYEEITFDTDSFSIYVMTFTQLKTYVISDSGDTYEITVTYGDDAEIPEGSELAVREIHKDEKEFTDNIELTNKLLAKQNEEQFSNTVQFDISIVYDGVEIEPKEGSVVNVEIKLEKSLFETEEDSSEEGGFILGFGEFYTGEESETSGNRIAHITDDGKVEIISEVKSKVEENSVTVQFETDSFSDYLCDGSNGNPPYRIQDLPSTIYVGDEIYVVNHQNYWVTGIGEGIVDEVTHPHSSGNQWNFKTVRALSEGTFRIYDNNDQSNYKDITILPRRVNGSGNQPPKIETISNASIGLKLNLFDYDLDGFLDDYYNGYPVYNNTTIADFASHGINAGHSLKFWGSGIGNQYGAINQYNEHLVANIVQNQLVNGYPALNDGESLAYLFNSDEGPAYDKRIYSDADGLFQKVGDYYIYNSNENYAWYNPATGKFEVYNQTYKQKIRTAGGEQASQLSDKIIGFFPFHPYDEEYDLYVNYDKNLNHHFGMSMSVDFALPGSPKAIKDASGNDIVFHFSGDDDMWVFIDGKLAMDIGGVHQPTDGTINFTTREVIVNGQQQTGFDFSGLYDGQVHTLQVFYIERGGCDSNCLIQFNITRYGDAFFEKVDEYDNAEKLQGAVFGIYRDESCTTPLMERLDEAHGSVNRAFVAESGADGVVRFTGLPLGTYYLKEIWAPEGYALDPTVHKVDVYLDSSGRVKARVSIDEQDVEETPGVIIKNKEPEPITVGLKKVWQNTDGEPITSPDGATATFEIKRIRRYEEITEEAMPDEKPETVNLVIGWVHNGQTHVYKEYTMIKNSTATITWAYKDGYGDDGERTGCIENGTVILKNKNQSNIYSEAINFAEGGDENTFYVIDDSDLGESILNIGVAGSEYIGNSGGGVIHIIESKEEIDPDFTYTGEGVTNNQVVLSSDNSWQYSFTNLPIAGQDNNHVYHYTYFLEEVAMNCPPGTTSIYHDLNGNEINTPVSAETSQSGTLSITNKVPTGYLQIHKEVTYNGVAPATDSEKSALAGTYRFGVYIDEACTKPYKVIVGEGDSQQEENLVLSITIEDDGTAKSSEKVKIPIGDYWIKELDETQNPLPEGVTPEENPIRITVTADNTEDEPAIVNFTNNKEDSDGPELAIELEKTFKGLPDRSKIPAVYHATLTYTADGSPVTVQLTGTTSGNVSCVQSEDGMTWHWRITHLPVDATDFAVSESDYEITGYDRTTTINGTVVPDPSNPEGIVVLVPDIHVENVTSDYTTPDSYKNFEVAENQLLFVRMTNHATVVVSQKSLSAATQAAIEKLLSDNGWKIPGDDSPQAQWDENVIYFSHEIQGDKFSYGGRTIYFTGNTVKIPHNASSHEVRVDLVYDSDTAENSFVIVNEYTEIPTDIDVLKVEKGKEETTKLPGAVFELRQLEDVAPTSSGTMTYVTDDNDEVIVISKTTDSNGRLTFDGLTHGYYEIREKTSPPGYVLEEAVVFYLKIDAGQVTYLEKGTGKPSTWTESDNTDATVHYIPVQTDPEANATFRVGNTPGAKLPSTGGPGTQLFTIFGILLIALAGLGLVMKNKHRLEAACPSSEKGGGGETL